MSWEDKRGEIMALQTASTEQIIIRIGGNGLVHPPDFETRVITMQQQLDQRTICSQTALFLLGMDDRPTVPTKSEIFLIDYDRIANYIATHRTQLSVADYELVIMIQADSAQFCEIRNDCPLVLLQSKLMPESVHWMVTDWKDPKMIWQTDSFNRPFRRTTLKEMIQTGNFGMLSESLKNPHGNWVFHFCR